MVSQEDHDQVSDCPSDQCERVPIPADKGFGIQSFNAQAIALLKVFEMVSVLVLINHIDFKDYSDCNTHEDDD